MSKQLYRCSLCNTEIDWDGADEKRGELWPCEQEGCGKLFCVACFKERFGHEAWAIHVNITSISKTGIKCPECFGQVQFDAQSEAKHLQSNGVTIKQIDEELEYRNNANIDEPEPGCHTCGWDDDLCKYTTAELERIQTAWAA